MSTILWLLVATGALLVVLLAVFLIYFKKGKYKQKETDYKAFFTMGIIWIIIFGGYSFFRQEFTMSGLFALGFVFLIMGAANRNKWKNSKPLSKNQKAVWYSLVVIIIAAVIVMYLFLP